MANHAWQSLIHKALRHGMPKGMHEALKDSHNHRGTRAVVELRTGTAWHRW